jgi:elongation factor 1-beta
MGEVVVTIRLMPKSTDVDLKRLEAEVRSRIKVHSIEREPIAFGLEALRIITIIPDSAGGTDPLEETLARIAGVASVQVIDVRRAL